MAEDLVLCVTDDDGVATVTFNRPDRKNGWSPDLEAAYFGTLDRLDRDPDVRAVVLTGAGTAFCPGMDAGRLNDKAGKTLDLSGRPPQYRPRALRKPLVAAINGACAGIGLVQALMCDVRFAARGAKFSTAFARRGLAAEYGLSWVLPRYVGLENALDLLLSARTFDADEAHRLGLVSRVVERDEVLTQAQSYAADLARNCAPTAVAAIRHQVYGDLEVGLDEALRRSFQVMAVTNGAADFVEGMRSFLERRPPKFAPLADDFDPAALIGSHVPGADLAADHVLGDGKDSAEDGAEK